MTKPNQPDMGVRNAEHFLSLGACMALKTLRIELESKSTSSLAEVLAIIDRRMVDWSERQLKDEA